MPRLSLPLPPTCLVLGLISMIILHLAFPVFDVIGSPWRYLGSIPVVAGIILNLWADRLFKRHQTEVKPFRASTSLIEDGPFRISRNPMYLGMILICAGAAILLGSVTPFLVAAGIFWLLSRRFITVEEHDLERQFGNRYLRYRRRVRRWI